MPNTCEIRNVVFDIGNVLVRWSPNLIMKRALGDGLGTPDFAQEFFGNEIWYRLNRGDLSEQEAKTLYAAHFALNAADIDGIFFHVKDTQALNGKTISLIQSLISANYRIYALSDNVREIVTYLRSRYDFWQYFLGVVISAEIGLLKPSREIFEHLLETYDLIPDQTVFLDDMADNVAGARSIGMHATQFIDADSAEADLKRLGMIF